MHQRRIPFAAMACAVLLSLAAAGPGRAQTIGTDWPQRTVRLIVPNPPGVGLDLVARLFAERLAARWGRPVIVENIPGADGNIAAREFVQRRDDHTLLHSFAGLITINPLVHQTLPYDPDRDLVPIAPTSENALAIAVSSESEARSLADVARLARARPGAMPGPRRRAFHTTHSPRS